MPDTETAHPAITAFTHHQTGIWQWEENEEILTSGSELNGYKSRLGVFYGAQKHVNCFDQSFKCICKIYLTLG